MATPRLVASNGAERILEGVTLGCDVVGVVVLGIAAVRARSVALGGFGFDSLIEIGASVVVLWELSGTGKERQRRALRLIGASFALLASAPGGPKHGYAHHRYHPGHSPLGIAWTALTALVMFALAAGKDGTGRRLDNPVLRTEGRVTLVDGLLATAVLAGLVLNAALGWWWADPLAGYVLLVYGTQGGLGFLVALVAARPFASASAFSERRRRRVSGHDLRGYRGTAGTAR